MRFCWPEAVAIESTRTDVVAGYDPQFIPEWTKAGSVAWREGGHERRFQIAELLEDAPNLLRFRDEGGDTHTLRTMTLEIYDRDVKPRTMGRPTFGSMAELLSVMRLEW